MKTKFVLLILSWAAVLAGVALIILHYTAMRLPVWWGSAFLAVGAVLSLAAVLLRQRERRAEEERERAEKKKKKGRP